MGDETNSRIRISTMNSNVIKIDSDLYRKVEEFIHATRAFESVDEYINFLLETLFLSDEQVLSNDETKILSERLRALGYLE
jgi:hypothetical protein